MTSGYALNQSVTRTSCPSFTCQTCTQPPPSWFSGVMASGGGTRPPRVAMRRTLPTKYFVIATDAIGNGLATSPSNSTARPRMKFPKYGIRDMVESQQRLLQHLGIARVVAVIGPSMGGMQTLQWGVSHPDMMDALVAMVPLARTPAWTITVLEASRKAI